jgi:hypothetical protein
MQQSVGVLLVAQEPLPTAALRQILEIDQVSLRDGLQHLGGLAVDACTQSAQLCQPPTPPYSVVLPTEAPGSTNRRR